MIRVSTREAARRFHRLLKEAEDAPVVIERYGRRRAVIMSAHDFGVVERILAREKDEMATRCLEAALERIADGQLNKAINLQNAARLLGGLIK